MLMTPNMQRVFDFQYLQQSPNLPTASLLFVGLLHPADPELAVVDSRGQPLAAALYQRVVAALRLRLAVYPMASPPLLCHAGLLDQHRVAERPEAVPGWLSRGLTSCAIWCRIIRQISGCWATSI